MGMIIESLIHRPNGTTVDLGGTTYRFLPSPAHEGKHIARVDDPEHAKMLLRITEGYAFVGPAMDVPAAAGLAMPVAPKAEPQEGGPDAAPVAPPPEPEPGLAPSDDAAPQSEASPVNPAALSMPMETPPLSPDMDRDTLAQIFEREIGRAPNPRHKPETIIAQIEAVRRERGQAAD